VEQVEEYPHELEEMLQGLQVPDWVCSLLTVIKVPFVDLEGVSCDGKLVVHKELASEVVEIFHEIRQAVFPIARMEPLSKYDWSDDRSMAANNTSAFNYRLVEGTTRLSLHALGRAIDINPAFNPWQRGPVVSPPGAIYDPARPGTITEDSAVVRAFQKRGWVWGGTWINQKDYHHFEKP